MCASGRAVAQVQTAGSGFGERVQLGFGSGVTEDLEGTADQAEVDAADNVGVFVCRLEQRAPGEPEAVYVCTRGPFVGQNRLGA